MCISNNVLSPFRYRPLPPKFLPKPWPQEQSQQRKPIKMTNAPIRSYAMQLKVIILRDISQKALLHVKELLYSVKGIQCNIL